jgi:hypothetical protein
VVGNDFCASQLTVFCVVFLAILAEPIAAISLTPLMGWYIASRRAGIVVVVNAIRGWLEGFIDGVKGGYLSHWDWSPVKDLGTQGSAHERR